MQNISSALFKLNSNDLIKGIAVAIIAVLLGSLQQAVTAHGIDVTAYDWNSILTVALTAGISYLGKNFLSTSDGAVLGAVGGATK